MRDIRRIAIVTVLALLLVVIAGCDGGSSGPAGSSGSTGSSGSSVVSVSMQNLAFDPSTIEVAVGGSVTFTNNDTVPHTVAGDTWGSDTLAPGGTYSQSFPAAGTFPIRCTIHPSMTASVVVK